MKTPRQIVEQLAEATSTHMLNMRLAPELTKDLVMNAEQQALDDLYQAMLEVIGEDEELHGGSAVAWAGIDAQNGLRRKQCQSLAKLFGRNV